MLLVWLWGTDTMHAKQNSATGLSLQWFFSTVGISMAMWLENQMVAST